MTASVLILFPSRLVDGMLGLVAEVDDSELRVVPDDNDDTDGDRVSGGRRGDERGAMADEDEGDDKRAEEGDWGGDGGKGSSEVLAYSCTWKKKIKKDAKEIGI